MVFTIPPDGNSGLDKEPPLQIITQNVIACFTRIRTLTT
jgi:hypothetical protein